MNNSNFQLIPKFEFVTSNYNILILDDSKSINHVLTKSFLREGYSCFSTFTIKEAKEILTNNEIHYVMLDINLPDGNGYEIITLLEKTSVKIFVLTTENDKQFRAVSYQKGIIDFIIKDQNFLYKVKQITISIENIEKNKMTRILLIDASFIVREQLKELLKNRHYLVQSVSELSKAKKILDEMQIDLIIFDVELKNENTMEFLRSNNNEIIQERNIPILAISGKSGSSTIRELKQEGAVDVILKPYIIEEIVSKVDFWTDYKRKEDEIRDTRALLHEYKEAVDRSSIVSKTDSSGIITYVNQEFCNISGYEKEELIGHNHSMLKHPDMDHMTFNDMWNTIKTLKQPWKGKIKNLKKDGDFYWVEMIINPILNLKSEVIEYISIKTDITEHVLVKEHFEEELDTTVQDLQHAMKLSKEYEMAIQNSNILSRTDLNGKITYINDKFCETTGYAKEELLGQSHSIIKHPDTPNELSTELWNTIKKGKPWFGIMKNINKAGNPIWINKSVIPIKDENNNIIEYMDIGHDLTELFNLHVEIEETQKEIIYKMGEIGETRSKETGNHVKRVAEYSRILARLYGLNNHESDILFAASPMHDIGKVGIADSILKKPGKLTPEEFEIMKTHAQIGHNILKGSKREVLKTAAIVSYEHHEKWDGSGYPRGLKGDNIHIYGRISAIADVFDALGSKRCYKDAWPDKKIFDLLEEEKGKQFDPKLIDLFFKNFEKFDNVRKSLKD